MRALRWILAALGAVGAVLLTMVGIRRRQTVEIGRPDPADPIRKAQPQIKQTKLTTKQAIARAEAGGHGTLDEERARAKNATERWRR